MKNTLIIIGVAVLAVFGAKFAASKEKAGPPAPAKAARTVLLEKKNTIAMRMPFTQSTVKAVQLQLMRLNGSLPKGEPIYLFLDTPGGSIGAGMELIGTAHGLSHEVKTITSFAASMGYMTVEHLGERLILPTGTLMAHRAFMGMEGQVPGEFNTRAKYVQDQITAIETTVATRLGLEHAAYAKLIKDEYWVGGQAAVDAKHADAAVNVSCAADLQGTVDEAVDTMFGTVTLTWSECPLISSPIAMSFGGGRNSLSAEEEAKFRALIYEVTTNKRSILNDNSLRDAFYRYIR